MPESIVQVNEGTGKKLHTWQRTVGANTVEDEVVLFGEPYLPTYNVRNTTAISVATANDHLMTINGSAGLRTYLKRLRVFQVALATTATTATFTLLRTITAAPTGGTAITPVAFDPADAAAGCTAMTLPTVKGTESTILWIGTGTYIQTLSATYQLRPVLELDFTQNGLKPPIIALGTTLGLALKQLTAVAAATVYIDVEIVESAQV